jgi:probable HAF family extracellular repeat protein
MAGLMAASETDHFSSVAFAMAGHSNAPVRLLSASKCDGSSAAQAMNRGGVMAGYAEIAVGQIHAVRFEKDGDLCDLDTMNNVHSSANGINDAGDAVGVFFNGAGDDDRAFLWHAGEMSDLNDLVEDGDAWILVEAFGINTHGQIAGYGVKDGREHAVLLTPQAGRKIDAVHVSLTQPSNNAVFSAPVTISLSAGATAEAGVKRVIFQANGETVGVATEPPYAIEWRHVQPGDYDLCAMAVTAHSEVRKSRRVRIRVTTPNHGPEAWIVRPKAAGKLFAGQTNELAAAAEDADGKITELRLIVDGKIVASSNNTHYVTVEWVAPSSGSVEFRAEATDDAGSTATSPVVRMDVRQP